MLPLHAPALHAHLHRTKRHPSPLSVCGARSYSGHKCSVLCTHGTVARGALAVGANTHGTLQAGSRELKLTKLAKPVQLPCLSCHTQETVQAGGRASVGMRVQPMQRHALIVAAAALTAAAAAVAQAPVEDVTAQAGAEDVTAQTAAEDVAFVTSAAALQSAFVAGTAHIVILQHLDLTGLAANAVETATGPVLFRPAPSTLSIRVRSHTLCACRGGIDTQPAARSVCSMTL